MSRFSYCAGQVRRLDYDRFLCAMLAPVAARESLFALYAFNLEVASIRELVNEPLLGRMRLQWWHEAVDGIYAGQVSPHPVVEPLAEAVRRFDLTRGHFEKLLDGRAFDLDDTAPPDLQALLDYVEATSASINLLTLETLQVKDAAMRRAARHVGIAWALIGLLRAVPFHSASRRVYLPAALSREAGLNFDELFEARPGPGIKRVVAEIAGTAEDHLIAARLFRHQTDKRAMAALIPATLADFYLGKLRAVRFDPFDPRVRTVGVGRILKLYINGVRGRY